MSSILEIQDVVKKYGDYTALNSVSLSIPKGSIYGLLGPNGAGKTSLIRIINQITMPDSGNVIFDGEKLQPKHVQYIGYLPEERGLYKSMKVGEQCLYLAQLKGLSKDEVEGTEFIISYDNCYKILEFGFQESSLDLKSTIEDFINEYTL